MIHIQKGDLFLSAAQTITNTINCVGVMGKGVALAFKNRFPEMYEDYKRRCRKGIVEPGKPYLYNELDGTSILMFPTKRHWRQLSRIEDIEQGLFHLASHYKEWGITSLAMPPLGCGNGGLLWADVAPLVYRVLHKLPIEITLYAPETVSEEEMTLDFLQGDIKPQEHHAHALSDACVIVSEVLFQLQKNPCVKPVGHVIFQKICYILHKLGVISEVEFEKATYGPYSPTVKAILQSLTRCRVLEESPLGHNMINIRTTPDYSALRGRYQALFERYADIISRTVDLFSRIQNTEHAEVIATILYSSQELKKAQLPESVSEWDVLHYMIRWKPHWNSPEMQSLIADNIRSLQMLRWLKLRRCEDFYKEEWEC
ncbi:MAG: macro domain-containing protein [Akkermansia sp.]|nr:macro domain-containing protein [Akkermansia sp.]